MVFISSILAGSISAVVDAVGGSQWIRGHAAIVISTEGDASKFITLEGNGNDEGGREGIKVARLERTIDMNNENGLRLLGFIYPIEEI